ncbi:MAG: hypothetical protein J07HQW2_03552 [Haloquadratum walsbyi J07HQW2]|uniref:Uncharacterized protein n=1 Tax=Haloquadratum walsbyi J07HQW2 TaxID=1238425 RepID=U1PX86_9EURY|nr:MAG: hypothetical protein J07HQW2_03552 [Haloquadratum walsbyi J07HQW2]
MTVFYILFYIEEKYSSNFTERAEMAGNAVRNHTELLMPVSLSHYRTYRY